MKADTAASACGRFFGTAIAITVRWNPPSRMREPGRPAASGGSESCDSANASAVPSRIIVIASSTEVAAVTVVRLSVRAALRIVVVLAMPTTRTPGRSTSASVAIPEAAVTRYVLSTTK